MSLALQSAISGLRAASQKFESAATDIVRSGAHSSTAVPAGADEPDLAGGLVSLKEAEVQFTASAKVIGALARTQERLLDILA